MTGAEIVLQALKDQGVEHIFGYPGGAVLPIYDEIFQQEDIEHILVRHEQGATHGRRLCPLHRQARRGAGDVRSRRDQRGHRPAPMR
jgi:glyoxylate carboligase